MSKREAIIQLHCVERTNSEIIKLLKVAKSTVVKRSKELGASEDSPISGRDFCTARAKKMIKAVQERVRKSQKGSSRPMAKT